MKKKALPKTVCVYWEKYENDEIASLVACPSVEDSITEAFQERRVGIYKLVEMVTVKTTLEIRRIRAHQA